MGEEVVRKAHNAGKVLGGGLCISFPVLCHGRGRRFLSVGGAV